MIFDNENVLFKAAASQQAKVAATLIYPGLFGKIRKKCLENLTTI